MRFSAIDRLPWKLVVLLVAALVGAAILMASVLGSWGTNTSYAGNGATSYKCYALSKAGAAPDAPVTLSDTFHSEGSPSAPVIVHNAKTLCVPVTVTKVGGE